MGLRVSPPGTRKVPGLLWRCWKLRANVTVYDAAYIALAERLGVPLPTADRQLANTPGARCRFEVIA
jgi:predicted nucleic acid-binding protein